MQPRTVAVPAVVATLLAQTPLIAAAAFPQPILRSGQPVPEAPGQTFRTFVGPMISDDGRIAVHASFRSAPEAPDQDVLLLRSQDDWSVLAMEGRDVSGAPPGTIYLRPNALKMEGGRTLGLSMVQDPSLSFDVPSITLGVPGDYRVIAPEGSVAPGAGCLAFNGVSSIPDLNAAGDVAFIAHLGTFSSGLFLAASTGITPVAVEGDPAPGTDDPFLRFDSVVINDSGHLAFTAGTGIPGRTQPGGVWVGPPDALRLVARGGQHAPGLPDDVRFGRFHTFSPEINAAGDVVFRADLSPGGSVNGTNDSGLWVTQGGQLTLVARASDPVPGVPGATFGNLSLMPQDPHLADSGRISFVADIIAPTGAGKAILTGVPGDLRTLLVSGQPAPGLPGEILGLHFLGLDVNNAGQMIVHGYLRGSGDQILLAYDPVLGWATLLREDEFIEFAPGDFRRVTGIGLAAASAPADDSYSALNELGHVVVNVSFPFDAHAIYVIAIPEPAAAAMLAPSLLLLRRPRFAHRPSSKYFFRIHSGCH
jgi:hypothetical protein